MGIPFKLIAKFPSAENIGLKFASTICGELDSGKTLEEAIRTAYRKHGVIHPSFFTRKFFNDPNFEIMFSATGVAIQNRGYGEIIADTPAMLHPFRRLGRTMGEVSKEMNEPKDRKMEIDQATRFCTSERPSMLPRLINLNYL